MRAAWLVGALLVVAGAGAAAAGANPPEPAQLGEHVPLPKPDRSREMLDYRCANELGLRQITLFANGTVRVREGLGMTPHMTLGELGPDLLEGFLGRILREDLSEVHDTQESAEGSWVERCTLRLDLDGRPLRNIAFSRFDSLPLSVATIVRIADEMATHALPVDDLPPRYHAQRGDVLRRADGVLFEVVGFTADHQGLELQGVEQPLVLYMHPEDVHGMFVELVSRRMP